MATKQERLISLIEFAQQSARLRSKAVSSISQHNLFALHEHQLQGLPGLHLNASSTESDDEVWLVVERLHETKPPEISNPLLVPWVQMTQSPSDEPKLRDAIDDAGLIDTRTTASSHGTEIPQEDSVKPSVQSRKVVALSEYEQASHVRSLFTTYLTNEWRPWAESEKLRRKTIQLYAKLFTLKQQLEGGIVETQIELLWGVGIGLWQTESGAVNYPLLGRLVELSLNPETAEIEIRPRDVDARLEVDWYAAADNLGVPDLERAAKEFFSKATKTFSPFDRGTYEPLLRSAVTHLDANGVYWPDEVPAEDRSLPKAQGQLKVTDTWVLFARPRTNSLFIQDLEQFKKSAEESNEYPPAVAAVVTDPATDNPVINLPTFRGASASYHSDSSEGKAGTKARDLYFPKPFNDEQVRIIQLLDAFDGVVVQGPPGTGKTHTIANVICHYLAEGHRVLVTSMKDAALGVLHDQLPDEIRPLAISLLTSEQEGMKQFEHAIHKIASEVQGLDRAATGRAIHQLEETIDVLHGKLAHIDRDISRWASLNLRKVVLDTEEIDPQDAAREVVESAGEFELIADPLGVSAEFTPLFGDSDIVRLREARRTLGKDIDYLDASLPQLVEFPDSRELLQVHQDLGQFQTLSQSVENGEVPALADSSQDTLARAQELLTRIAELQHLRNDILQARCTWTAALRDRLRHGSDGGMLTMLGALGEELQQATALRQNFLERPVSMPPGVEMDDDFIEAVANLATGKSAFGLMGGLFGKAAQKKSLEAVQVLGKKPISPEDWAHAKAYLDLLRQLRELALRWNALAAEFQLETVQADEPEGGLAAAQAYALYIKVKEVVRSENNAAAAVSQLFPNWPQGRELADNEERLVEVEKALRHHLTKNRLAHVWDVKERFQKVLEGRKGAVVEAIRRFLGSMLGNPDVVDAEMQAAWSDLMSELVRVLGLGSQLATVEEVSGHIAASGAPKYAEALRKPFDGAIDTLLPDNWRKAWRLRRLATHLETIDAQDELKKLAKLRHDVESDLARAYRDLVVKRTWLKLAENASPSIRSALQSYLTAIQKIGKGTGKRAIRYRQDARQAASQANPAVPCWIMPHYRVSESLPPELGCFDLVIIDEASQSDLTALPALLRARKVLIVGDDKQVSPEGVGLEEEKVRSLMNRFLDSQVETFRPQMSPERSIYDLFKVVFAQSSVMLKEHFRCVPPIIEYSKREFYNHELRPLRVPKASERLDPPLIDVMVLDGYRRGDVNQAEARFIVNEIKKLADDPKMAERSIGVVSLLADKQALEVWNRLSEELGPERMERHRIACGDARTFQGKERDIMFLSMVSAPNEVGAPLSRDTFAQRFNVAASRARDRMYLVRSVEMEHLSAADKLRRSLISHFSAPYAQDEARVEDLRALCESPFEREMYDELTQRGYLVTPQVKVGQYRIDMVVEGNNDARLAIECDGDQYHGADKWADDMHRQRILERAGWVFWRSFASTFVRRRQEVLEDLVKTLADHGIDPVGAEGAPRSVHTELRTVDSASTPLVPLPEEAADAEQVDKPSTPSLSGSTTSREVIDEVMADEAPILVPSLLDQPRSKARGPNGVGKHGLEKMEQIWQLCNANQLKNIDKRDKGGALWVHHHAAEDQIAQQLGELGFKFSAGKGWWLK